MPYSQPQKIKRVEMKTAGDPERPLMKKSGQTVLAAAKSLKVISFF